MTKTFLLISRVEFISESNFNCLRCKIKNKIEKRSKMAARLSSVKGICFNLAQTPETKQMKMTHKNYMFMLRARAKNLTPNGNQPL